MVARKTLAALALCAVLAAPALAGCGDGADASCSTSQCTLTFDRGVSDANINILGVEVRLVSATDNTVTLKVGGQELTLPVNQTIAAGDFSLEVQSITDSQIVVTIARNVT